MLNTHSSAMSVLSAGPATALANTFPWGDGALVALGLLDRDDDGYRNTAETDLYLDPAKPTYMGGMLEFHNTTVYQPWASLTERCAPVRVNGGHR